MLFASGRAQTLGRLSIFCLAGEERSQEMENSGHCLLHEVVGGSNVKVEFTLLKLLKPQPFVIHDNEFNPVKIV